MDFAQLDPGWQSLYDVPDPYNGPQMFAPVVQPETRSYYSHAAVRDRAIQDYDTKRRQEQLQLQAMEQAAQQQRELDAAMPALSQLDTLSPDYPNQRRTALSQLGRTAFNPRVQALLRESDQSNRYYSKQDPALEKAYAQDSDLMEHYQDLLDSGTDARTAKRETLRKHNNNQLTKSLVDYGLDLTKPGALDTVRDDQGNIDPLKTASWIKTHGSKGPATLTRAEKLKLLDSDAKLRAEYANPLTEEDAKPVIQQHLKLIREALGPDAAPAPASAPSGSPTAPATRDTWQGAKELIAQKIQAQSKSPEEFQATMADPAARAKAFAATGLAGKPAFQGANYDAVLGALIEDRGFLSSLGVDPVKAQGHQMVNPSTGKTPNIKSIKLIQ